MGLRFLGALPGWTVFKEDQRTDEFITPLDLIHKVELELRQVLRRCPSDSLYAYIPWPASPGARPCSCREPMGLACKVSRKASAVVRGRVL